MGLLRSVRSEVKKLFRSRLLYALFFIMLVAPAAGMFTQYGLRAVNQSGIYILAAVKTGAMVGCLIFPVYAIYELDRAKRSRTVDILETLTDMQTLYASKAVAIAFAAAVGAMAACAAYLPYTALHLGSNFDLWLYLASYTGIMMTGVVLGVLAASGFYLITRRLDAGIVLYALWVFLGSNMHNNYLMHWIDTNITVYSDYFGNAAALRVMLWNRLFALMATGFVFMAGIICTRRYNRSVFYAMRHHLKKAGFAACIIVLGLSAASVYLFEPLFDNSKDLQMQMVKDEKSGTITGVSVIERETNDQLSLLQTDCDIDVDAPSASLSGKARYQIQNHSGQPQQLHFQMQPGHTIRSLLINGEPASYQNLGQGFMGGRELTIEIPADRESALEIEYGGWVQESRLLQDSFGNMVISDDLIALAGNALAPALQINTSGNSYRVEITLPAGLMPVSTGNPAKQTAEDPQNKTATWALSSKGSGMQVLAGRYEMAAFKAGGIDVEFYYHKEHSEAVKSLNAVDAIRDAVDFYTNMLGALDYHDIPLKIVENPATMLGGGAMGNICNIGESIFSPESFANSTFEGTNGVEVLAHEICHQWWGVGTRFEQKMPWTPEGLTVFTTYKFLEHRYGGEYAKKTNVEVWKTAVDMLKKNFYHNNPQYYDILPPQYLFSILGMNNGIVMYQQMSMQIYRAEQILGEDKFSSALAKLYRRNKNGLSYEAFLSACNLKKEDIEIE